MKVNEEIFYALMDSGIAEDIAYELAKLPEEVKPARKAKTKTKTKTKTKVEKTEAGYPCLTRVICSVCGAIKQKETFEKKARPEKILELITCPECITYLKETLTPADLVSLLVLQNHPEESLSGMELHTRIALSKKKPARHWLTTRLPRTSDTPDAPAEKQEEAVEVKITLDLEAAVTQLMESGISEEMARTLVKAPKLTKQAKPRKKKKKDIIITKTCELCNTKVCFKHQMVTKEDKTLSQVCSISLCENCVRLFESMTSEQLIALLLIQNSTDIELRLLPVKEQLTLAMFTAPEEVSALRK